MIRLLSARFVYDLSVLADVDEACVSVEHLWDEWSCYSVFLLQIVFSAWILAVVTNGFFLRLKDEIVSPLIVLIITIIWWIWKTSPRLWAMSFLNGWAFHWCFIWGNFHFYESRVHFKLKSSNFAIDSNLRCLKLSIQNYEKKKVFHLLNLRGPKQSL